MQTLLAIKTQSWLIWFLRGVVTLGFLVLAGRLVDLQIIRGKYFRVLAEENRIRRVVIVAPRGRSVARGGDVITDNGQVQKEVVFEKSGIEKHDAETSESTKSLITEWVRTYPQADVFAHLTGYLGEVSQEELGKVEAQCLEKGPRKLGALIGRGGLEEKYDCTLRGIDGEELIEVDAFGERVRTLGRKNPTPGRDIHTTIDFGLQKKLAEMLKSDVGAAVITDPKGEILAFYSSPSYDPNVFNNEAKQKEAEEILTDEKKPLFNRVIGGKYHPGSVFKPVVAVAALEEEKIDGSFTYEDNGYIAIKSVYGDFTFNNWYFTEYGGREGTIDLERAITRSTDSFFYQIGELTGVEKIADWSHTFGLDEVTGIDIPGEIAGLVPNPVWKVRVKAERWFLGNTYHLSIGQGDIALTPIAVNQAIAAISNGGEYCSPHILNEEAFAGNFLCRDLGIKKENIDLVKKGMVGACSLGGTGYTFFDFKEKSGYEVGCKTGTAEVGDGTDDTHAWFTAFAPKDDPEIIATILVERGGEGSRVAGPIAREIFNYYFKVPPANDR